MSYTLKGLKERLKWITQSETQATWLKNYLNNRNWFDDSIYGDIFDTDGKEFLDLIKYEWGLLGNTANERERISKARSAWNSYSKETKNQTYSLSPDVTRSVNRLAKKNDITRSKAIEELVRQADDIDKLERKIRKLLKTIETKDDDGYSIKYLTQSINDVFNVNELKEELEAATEMLRVKEFEHDSPQELTDENEYLKNELRELTNQLKQSKEECIKYQKMAEKAQSDLDEYLNS
ncbi:hypothetical protein RJD40_14250 [Vibrio scophthalmi]|uniref:hypothetical protein n=1 Tax=Vibrio scophthalmi TaxID=45658 RepID=UPI003AB02BF0